MAFQSRARTRFGTLELISTVFAVARMAISRTRSSHAVVVYSALAARTVATKRAHEAMTQASVGGSWNMGTRGWLPRRSRR